MESTAGTGASSARVMSILAFVMAVVALFFLPILFGPIAIVLGGIATAKGDSLGKWALAAGIVGMVGGMALGAAVWNATND
jgi:hypothetical protein